MASAATNTKHKIKQMQRKTVGAVILSLARGSLYGVFGLLLLADSVWSQTFNNFRFVGLSTLPAGTVTSLSMDTAVNGASGAVNAGELSYFDASGLSTVFNVRVTPSPVLNRQTTVLVQTEDSFQTLTLQDQHTVEFYTAELTHDSVSTPPNWFRLRFDQGVWSGVFRVGNQVYSLPRDGATNVVEVRSTLSDTVRVSPTHRGKVSTVFNTGYFQNGPINVPGSYLSALESIHISDGLMSDSLGLSLQLEQIVITNVFDSVDGSAPETADIAAINWHRRNNSTVGTEDNLATLFFVDASNNTSTSKLANGASVATDDGIILQPLSADADQFSTAHSFGALLNLGVEARTLQDWQQSDLVSLPAVHWSRQQRENFEGNPSVAALLQRLANDQADAEPPALPTPAPLDQVLVESDSEERQPLLPQNDSATLDATASGGGGVAVWWLLAGLVFYRQRATRGARLET